MNTAVPSPNPRLILTRRIQIQLQGENKEELKAAWTDPVHARRSGNETKRMQKCAKVLCTFKHIAKNATIMGSQASQAQLWGR